MMIGKYVIVRTSSAGVFAGILSSRKDTEVVLKGARRLWYWSGASSLSELAMKGTSKPHECKFPVPVKTILLLGVIEIILTTKKAENSIRKVTVWTQH